MKCLSNTWDEEQAKAVAKFGKDINEESAADLHSFQITSGCHWADLRRATENHGVVNQNIMQRIDEANPTRLAQIIGSVPWAYNNKKPAERLERLVDHFSQRNSGRTLEHRI